MVITEITVVVTEVAIVVGFGGEQFWSSFSSGETLDDSGDLSLQLSLVPSQDNCLI